jgi:hypothetical protein
VTEDYVGVFHITIRIRHAAKLLGLKVKISQLEKAAKQMLFESPYRSLQTNNHTENVHILCSYLDSNNMNIVNQSSEPNVKFKCLKTVKT